MFNKINIITILFDRFHIIGQKAILSHKTWILSRKLPTSASCEMLCNSPLNIHKRQYIWFWTTHGIRNVEHFWKFIKGEATFKILWWFRYLSTKNWFHNRKHPAKIKIRSPCSLDKKYSYLMNYVLGLSR